MGNSLNNGNLKAVCFIKGNNNIMGTITIEHIGINKLSFHVSIDNIKQPFGNQSNSLHGLHIHDSEQFCDNSHNALSKCDRICAHYNPFKRSHGDRNSIIRHLGDLGNVQARYGKVRTSFVVDGIDLIGPYSIIGKYIVLHEDEDDLGLGINEESKITGNAGKRIACGEIQSVLEASSRFGTFGSPDSR